LPARSLHVIEDSELAARGIVGRQYNFRLRTEFFRHLEPVDEPQHFRFGDLLEPFKVIQLGFDFVVCPIKPVTLLGGSMDAKRPADRVPEFIRSEFILTGKDLDSFRQSRAAFDGDLQAASQVINVDAAVSGKQRFVSKDPKMSAAPRLFERGFYAVLAQLLLQLEQIVERVLVVGVDGDPLGALRLRVESVETHR
jgi:hypothetical protein